MRALLQRTARGPGAYPYGPRSRAAPARTGTGAGW